MYIYIYMYDVYIYCYMYVCFLVASPRKLRGDGDMFLKFSSRVPRNPQKRIPILCVSSAPFRCSFERHSFLHIPFVRSPHVARAQCVRAKCPVPW